MSRNLCENIKSNVYILGKDGAILGYRLMEEFYCSTIEEIVNLEGHYPDDYNDLLLKTDETQVNISREGKCVFASHKTCVIKNKYTTVIPILGGGERLGTLVLSKYGEFDSNDLILGELGATVVGMEILRAKLDEIESTARQKTIVSIAFDTLSYSELEAVEHIFKELNGSSGLLVASKIADKAGITRSVIVNALRKLESAGTIEVRSLGMKGTYINVLNDYLLEELSKLQKTRNKF